MSNANKIIQAVEADQMKKDLPAFNPGDTVEVKVKVKEGDRERLQAFEGVVVAKRNRGLNSAFTVRKVAHSPQVAEIAVKRRGDVARAKLYYLRDRAGKSARIKEKLD